MKKNIIILFVVLSAVSCTTQKVVVEQNSKDKINDTFLGQYEVIEEYNVLAGGLTGKKGESNYSITILPGSKENEIFIENFANSYKVTAYLNKDTLTIPSQKFPFQNSKVMIIGKGKLLADTIRYEYYSGGPAGQIECKCIAVKKK